MENALRGRAFSGQEGIGLKSFGKWGQCMIFLAKGLIPISKSDGLMTEYENSLMTIMRQNAACFY